MTQQVSHRPIKYQSRLWSQRGTKVNRSHYGDNLLLRPTRRIEIATKRYATLQAMAPTIIIKIQFPRTRNFLETSGSGTQYTIQGTGVKRVASTAERYWVRDLANDYQYHGRQQEAPRIARTRLLYSAKANQRRDERPQNAWSHHRCCGRSDGRHVKRHSQHALASDIRRSINERSRRLDQEDHCKDLHERGPADCFRRQYRMPQQTFEKLADILRPLLAVNCSFAIAVSSHAP